MSHPSKQPAWERLQLGKKAGFSPERYRSGCSKAGSTRRAAPRHGSPPALGCSDAHLHLPPPKSLSGSVPRDRKRTWQGGCSSAKHRPGRAESREPGRSSAAGTHAEARGRHGVRRALLQHVSVNSSLGRGGSSLPVSLFREKHQVLSVLASQDSYVRWHFAAGYRRGGNHALCNPSTSSK